MGIVVPHREPEPNFRADLSCASMGIVCRLYQVTHGPKEYGLAQVYDPVVRPSHVAACSLMIGI